MRVMCGGEDGVMGIYGGELLPDAHSTAEHRLVRVDAIYAYPDQRAIITRSIVERLPLPWGAVVRMRIIGPCEGARALNRAGYDAMLKEAHRRLTEALKARGDEEACRILAGRRPTETGISGSYCRK